MAVLDVLLLVPWEERQRHDGFSVGCGSGGGGGDVGNVFVRQTTSLCLICVATLSMKMIVTIMTMDHKRWYRVK